MTPEDLGELPIDETTTNETTEASETTDASGDATTATGTSTTSEGDEWTPEAIAMAAVATLNIWCSRAYDAPLSGAEMTTLQAAYTPLARKYLSGSMPVELVALGATAMIVVPRHFAARRRAAEESNDAGHSARPSGNGQEPNTPPANVGSLSALDEMFGGGARPV